MSQPRSRTGTDWWPAGLAEALTTTIEKHRERLETASDLLLGVALVMLFTGRNQNNSALVGTLWLLLRLVISPQSRGFHWPLVLLILLDLRGVLLQQGPKPVGPTDYLIIICAFVAGTSRSLRQWRRTVLLIGTATLIGCLYNLPIITHAIAAIAQGTAHTTGVLREDWAGQYFRAGDMTVNQTAMACGLNLCLVVPLGLRERGWRRWWMGLCAIVTAISCYATGSRLALALPMLLLAVTLWSLRRPHGEASGSQAIPRRLSAGKLRGLTLAALTTGAGLTALSLSTGWLGSALHLYVARKIPGDLNRIKVLTCYMSLPFREPDYWLYGAGYDAARIRFCDEDVGILLTHAHNFFGQTMADSGLVSAAAIIFGALALLSRIPVLFRTQLPDDSERELERILVPGLTAATLFMFIFSLFELTMMKASLLLIMFGFIPSFLFFRPRISACDKDPNSKNPDDREKLSQLLHSSTPTINP